MTHAKHVQTPTPTKLTPATRAILVALGAGAVLVAFLTVLVIRAMPDPVKGGGSRHWVNPSAATSTLYPSDVEKLRSLNQLSRSADDGLQKLQATANADPQSDTPQEQLQNAIAACNHILDQYLYITQSDPGAAVAAGLPASLGMDKASDCEADDPDAVASLPPVS